jgi:hypothetical protein
MSFIHIQFVNVLIKSNEIGCAWEHEAEERHIAIGANWVVLDT